MQLPRAFPIVFAQGGAHVVLPGGSMQLCMVLGIGLNYAKHAAEQGAKLPERPVVFAKNIGALTGGYDEIVVPRICQDATLTQGGTAVGPSGLQVDYEGELAVIIGGGPDPARACRDVDQADAGRFVLGYAVANDVSARWWQKSGGGGQFVRGKSFDTFCPIGEVCSAAWLAQTYGLPHTEAAQRLSLRTKVNGELRQESSTADMIFPIAQLVSELSRGTTLRPGTVILTGTPEGVGMARTPQAFLRDGDLVEVEIEAAGRICNRVRFE